MNINLTLFMQAAAFAAFIWFTAKFIWPPLMGAIASRQKQIADGLAAGEQGRKELANTEKRIADMLAEAKGKAAEIVATGEKFRAETVDAAKGEAKAEADRIIAGHAHSSRTWLARRSSCATRSPIWRSRERPRSCSAKSIRRRTPSSWRRSKRSSR
jgi:hypothetical protein